MNFNVYVDKRTGEKLQHLAKRRGASRNMLVREALEHLLDREAVTGWPDLVLDYSGTKGFESFEKHRNFLKPPITDPLA